MTPEGILTGEDLKFDSTLGAKVVRLLHSREVVELHRARERQLRIAAQQEERRRFGDGACVTMSLDPVIFMRIARDPRFTTQAFTEKEFEKDMRKWHPEFMVKTRHDTKHFALGAIAKRGAGSVKRGAGSMGHGAGRMGHGAGSGERVAGSTCYDKDQKYLVAAHRKEAAA